MDKIKNKKINHNIEILRGYAALIVIIGHMIGTYVYFDINYMNAFLIAIQPHGHIAVFVFFVLSGYVIGVSQKERLKGSNIITYLRKRFIRIYPIYFIAMLLGFLVANTHYPIYTILTNFTLTQNIFYNVIWENCPAWSLNYEVLFYLLFIPVSYLKVNPAITFLCFLVIGTIALFFPVNPIITGYSYGYCFWTSGLYMAKKLTDEVNLTDGFSQVKVLPILLYFFGIEAIIGLDAFRITYVFNNIKRLILQTSVFWSQIQVTLDDLIFLPYCFMIVLFFANKDFPYKKFIFAILQLLPIFIIYSKFKHHINVNGQFYVGMGYLAFALLTYFVKVPENYIKKLGLKLGSISYGIYIIHFPILYLFGRFKMYDNNWYFYSFRVILFLSITIYIGWLLEQKLQPLITKRFNKASTIFNKLS